MYLTLLYQDTNMTEIENFLTEYCNEKTPYNTKVAYKNRHKRLINMYNIKDFKDIEDAEILNGLKENVDSGNTQKALLNLIIMIREKLYQYEVKDLRNYRDKIQNLITTQKRINNEEEIELPSFEELHTHLEQLFNRKQYKDFIVMYLLLHYYTRNKDLDLLVVEKKGEMTDPEANYIWYNQKKKTAIYYRNNYKTIDTYGKQQHEITDEKFIKAIKTLFGEKLMKSDNISYYVMRASGGLGEGRIVKCVLDHYRKLGDLQTIQKISHLRGTSLETLVSEYDISLKREVGTQTD